MQLEFTNLITQANANTRKAVRPVMKKSKASPRKHIAEQFEFSFVRQMGGAK